MTATSAMPGGPSSSGPSSIDTVDRGQARTGPFVLTLCPLAGPVSVRPPQSPQLKHFTFFTTCAHQRDGGEQVYLHMGYFETLTAAHRLLQVVRRRFPHAIAIPAPAASPQPDPAASARYPTQASAPAAQRFAPVADESLTDTQVMQILESRTAAPGPNEVEESSSAQIELVRPEDTSTRRALKDAVVRGEPVFFAVQLDWSARPIDPGRSPSLPVFKTHTLYTTKTLREGRCRYFLRLGFFTDAASAKEAAFHVRSKFASALVVPVTEEEITRARETSPDILGFSHAYPPIDEPIEHSRTPSPAAKPNRAAGRSQRSRAATETLEQTLEMLAAREAWNDPDSLSESGVRHLRIEVLKSKSG